MMVEEAGTVASLAGLGISGDYLAFPLWIQNVDEGFEIARGESTVRG